MEHIVHPITNQKFTVTSKIGLSILKNYVQCYKTGGMLPDDDNTPAGMLRDGDYIYPEVNMNVFQPSRHDAKSIKGLTDDKGYLLPKFFKRTLHPDVLKNRILDPASKRITNAFRMKKAMRELDERRRDRDAAEIMDRVMLERNTPTVPTKEQAEYDEMITDIGKRYLNRNKERLVMPYLHGRPTTLKSLKASIANGTYRDMVYIFDTYQTDIDRILNEYSEWGVSNAHIFFYFMLQFERRVHLSTNDQYIFPLTYIIYKVDKGEILNKYTFLSEQPVIHRVIKHFGGKTIKSDLTKVLQKLVRLCSDFDASKLKDILINQEEPIHKDNIIQYILSNISILYDYDAHTQYDYSKQITALVDTIKYLFDLCAKRNIGIVSLLLERVDYSKTVHRLISCAVVSDEFYEKIFEPYVLNSSEFRDIASTLIEDGEEHVSMRLRNFAFAVTQGNINMINFYIEYTDLIRHDPKHIVHSILKQLNDVDLSTYDDDKYSRMVSCIQLVMYKIDDDTEPDEWFKLKTASTGPITVDPYTLIIGKRYNIDDTIKYDITEGFPSEYEYIDDVINQIFDYVSTPRVIYKYSDESKGVPITLAELLGSRESLEQFIQKYNEFIKLIAYLLPEEYYLDDGSVRYLDIEEYYNISLIDIEIALGFYNNPHTRRFCMYYILASFQGFEYYFNLVTETDFTSDVWSDGILETLGVGEGGLNPYILLELGDEIISFNPLRYAYTTSGMDVAEELYEELNTISEQMSDLYSNPLIQIATVNESGSDNEIVLKKNDEILWMREDIRAFSTENIKQQLEEVYGYVSIYNYDFMNDLVVPNGEEFEYLLNFIRDRRGKSDEEEIGVNAMNFYVK